MIFRDPEICSVQSTNFDEAIKIDSKPLSWNPAWYNAMFKGFLD